LRGKHSILKTIDSDAYPIGFLQMDYRIKRKPDSKMILLETKRKKAKTMVDMRVLRHKTLSRLQMTPISFAIYCILNGTDYVTKDLATHYVKIEAVQSAVADLSEKLDRVWGTRVSLAAPSQLIEEERAKRLDSLKRLLFRIYWYDITEDESSAPDDTRSF